MVIYTVYFNTHTHTFAYIVMLGTQPYIYLVQLGELSVGQVCFGVFYLGLWQVWLLPQDLNTWGQSPSIILRHSPTILSTPPVLPSPCGVWWCVLIRDHYLQHAVRLRPLVTDLQLSPPTALVVTDPLGDLHPRDC